MTEVGQKKQKKKVTKMALSDFLSDPCAYNFSKLGFAPCAPKEQTTGSWADEMDDLPSAPADSYRSGGFNDDRGGRGFSSRGGFGDRSEREESRFQPRAPVDLPTRPPYTIHLGNLPFDATESDIEGFFIESKITSIRIMKDFEDKPKGFGYVEFDSLDSLKKALENNGQSLCGRNVRVSVAEPPREREVREDRTTGEWRRAEPLPPVNNRFNNDRSNDRGNDRFADRGDRGDRGERREFGARFNNSERPPDRTAVNSWRREEPLPVTETRPGWEKPKESNWGRSAPAPAARRKLELKPRSADAPAPAAAAAAAEAKNTKSSPFGAAKPIDNDEAIRRVEEKLKQEQREKKEAAEKARKERESKEKKDAPADKKAVEEKSETESLSRCNSDMMEYEDDEYDQYQQYEDELYKDASEESESDGEVDSDLEDNMLAHIHYSTNVYKNVGPGTSKSSEDQTGNKSISNNGATDSHLAASPTAAEDYFKSVNQGNELDSETEEGIIKSSSRANKTAAATINVGKKSNDKDVDLDKEIEESRYSAEKKDTRKNKWSQQAIVEGIHSSNENSGEEESEESDGDEQSTSGDDPKIQEYESQLDQHVIDLGASRNDTQDNTNDYDLDVELGHLEDEDFKV
ncbi:hypothetical protein BGZ49_000645 [Haplosporangium sp. Z 27]|nr:hypothetical protein BGZ49_000645 [Haplosporangium sp. Z 27]